MNMMNLYNTEKNPYLEIVKNLVPRIVTYSGNFAFCLIEKDKPQKYYCFLSKYWLHDMMTYCSGDVIKKMSLEDYFKTSYILKRLGFKFNFKKIIYDSNRNK